MEPSFLQPGEALETVGVYRGTWGHVLLQEGQQRCALEVRDDRHAGAPGSIAPLLHGNKDQGIAASPQPQGSCRESRTVQVVETVAGASRTAPSSGSRGYSLHVYQGY